MAWRVMPRPDENTPCCACRLYPWRRLSHGIGWHRLAHQPQQYNADIGTFLAVMPGLMEGCR